MGFGVPGFSEENIEDPNDDLDPTHKIDDKIAH